MGIPEKRLTCIFLSNASLTFANGFVDVEFKKAKTDTSAVDIEAV